METVHESVLALQEAIGRDGRLSACLVRGVDVSGMSFEGSTFDRAGFRDVTFGGSDLRRSELVRCELGAVDLRGARATSAVLRECRFRASNLIEIRLRQGRLLGCQLDDSRMSNADLTGSLVSRCAFTDVDLYGACFRDAFVLATSFRDARLGNTVLSGADFRDATLVDVDLQGANLRGARFEGAVLVRCDLRGCDLSTARLEGVRLVATPTDRVGLDPETAGAMVATGATPNGGPPATAFADWNAERLRSLLAAVLETYVVGAAPPVVAELLASAFPRHLRDLDFPALVQTLQRHLDLPELGRFVVGDDGVRVRVAGGEHPLAGAGGGEGGAAPSRLQDSKAPSLPSADRPPSDEGDDDGVDDRFNTLEID